MSKTKTPTLKEKVTMYEDLFHELQMMEVCGNPDDRIGQLLSNIYDWSYAHRVGNGELSEKEQQQIINRKFWKLLDIPVHTKK